MTRRRRCQALALMVLLPALLPASAGEKLPSSPVYRSFQKGSAGDSAAERLEIRLGLSGYPRHMVVDPDGFRLLSGTPRTAEGIARAIEAAAAATKPVDPAEVRGRMKELARASR